MATSYNGWTASTSPSAIGIVRFEPIPGHDFPAGVKGGDVHYIFTYLVRQLDARVEPIEEYAPGDEWGYNYRPNTNNPSQLSCHASGTAIDYNATQHPNRIANTWTTAQKNEIHEILQECSGVVKWLEGWDEMHFEINGTAAQVKAAADKLRLATAPTPPDEQEGPMYRIYWFKGEPTEPGDQPNAVAAYRVLCAKAEKKAGTGDKYIAVSAWWIKDPAELKVWQDRGLATMNKPETASALRSTIEMFNGPFDNTKTP